MPAFGSLHSLLEAWWFALGSLPSISALSLATSAALPSLAACPPSRATAAAQASTPPADSACSWPQRTPLRRARLRSRLGRAHQYCVGRLLPVQHMDVGARVWGHSSLVLQMPRPKCLVKRLRRDRALMTTQEKLGGVSESRRFRPGGMAHTYVADVGGPALAAGVRADLEPQPQRHPCRQRLVRQRSEPFHLPGKN